MTSGRGDEDLAIADSNGLPVAVHVESARPHEVTLVKATIAQRLVLKRSEHRGGMPHTSLTNSKTSVSFHFIPENRAPCRSSTYSRDCAAQITHPPGSPNQIPDTATNRSPLPTSDSALAAQTDLFGRTKTSADLGVPALRPDSQNSEG